MHMVEYRRNQKQLRETPALSLSQTADTAEAYQLLRQAIADGATTLDTHEVQPILRARGLQTLPTLGLQVTARKRCILPRKSVTRWP